MRFVFCMMLLPLFLLAGEKMYISPDLVIINEDGMFYAESLDHLIPLQSILRDDYGLCAEKLFEDPWYCRTCKIWNGGLDKKCRKCKVPKPVPTD